MSVGTGKVTKTVMEFLKIEGSAILISNEIDYRFVMQKAFDNNIGLRNLAGKKFKQIDFNSYSLTAIQY